MIMNPVVSHGGGSDWEEVENFAQIIDYEHWPSLNAVQPFYVGAIQWLVVDNMISDVYPDAFHVEVNVPILVPAVARPLNQEATEWEMNWVISMGQFNGTGDDYLEIMLDVGEDLLSITGSIPDHVYPTVQLSTGNVDWGSYQNMANLGETKFRYLKYNGPEAFRWWQQE